MEILALEMQKNSREEMMNENKALYDCVIVGGGSAGLSAALLLGRSRRRVLVCDKGNPRNASAHESHSFFTRDGISPHELLSIGRDQLKPYESVEFQAIAVKEINSSGNQFEVVFEDGRMKRSRKILLAFGVIDEFPNIENFGDFWGKSVFHCPYCHAWEVRDEPLAVVGNGETGIEMAALLRNWSADLVLCTNGKAELTAEQKTLLENRQILVREEKIIRLEGDNGRLETIVFEAGEKIARHGILIRPMQTLRSNLAEKLGCELNEFNLIKTTNVFNETSVKGVYAAGDITSPMQAIAAAVFQGSVAANGLNHALIMEDFV